MKKLPKDDPRAARMSSNVVVDLEGLIAHVQGKHQWVLSTTRSDGRPQMSLVSGGMTSDGDLMISSYPSRVKVKNARRNPLVSVAVMGDGGFSAPWVQIDGEAEVLDMPEAVDGLVEYYRAISGEHPDWDEYRQAMADQGKSVLRIRPTRWSPISKGGFPPELFED
ncbi:MAG: PPOX class F420-dependent oxidoreductase [Actinomycetota bacterium]